MKLIGLKINERDNATYGLKKRELRFRNSVTVLAGKNGSGKSRTLSLIKDKIFEVRGKNLSNIPKYMEKESGKPNFERYKKSLLLHFTPEVIRTFQAKLKLNNKVDNFDYDGLISTGPEEYIGNELDIITSTAINHFYKFPTLYLLKRSTYSGDQDRNWKATKIYQQFKSLKQKFETFLGKQVECVYDEKVNNAIFDAEGNASGIKANWLLNGRVFKYEELSDGEKTLFAYILLFYLHEQYPYSKAKDSIVLIDEPETHLHPQAQIKLIKGLIELTQEFGQVILATHSIPILSICKSDSIFFIKDSTIYSPSSKIPKVVLEDLIGYEELKTHLSPLLSNVSTWAFNSFLIDCFDDPTIISDAKPNDPQYQQLTEFLEEHESLRILDFGAGKGRLEKALQRDGINHIIDVYDPNEENIKDLKVIEGVNSTISYLNDIKENYDLVILSNVLHEIPIEDWTRALNKISNNLSEQGYLMVLEDLELRVGEKPNDNGYLVLNSQELSVLLNFKGDPIIINPHNEFYQSRLECTVFNSNGINQINKNTIKKALEKLKDRSFRKALEHRSSEYYKDGRTYAFYAEQYINAVYSLDKIK